MRVEQRHVVDVASVETVAVSEVGEFRKEIICSFIEFVIHRTGAFTNVINMLAKYAAIKHFHMKCEPSTCFDNNAW